ncbi:MAG: bifunctional DNA-formamidopyrimidine glycosylase/DNA-(apurinic or apyrimidinic site) lyase [Methylocystis sp.]|nr:bifunctional DNA-formamidopyrimidine glycosylase/DNA-(apurinic or apyrimidinic site) lyase [Methylocystis sp.]
MPELPEVEIVRRGLERVFARGPIARVEQRRHALRFAFPEGFAKRLAGRRVQSLRRRAKYLIADLDDQQALIMHLGMSGSFRVERAAEPSSLHHPLRVDRAHDHVVFHLDGGIRVIYNDPRRFGFMSLALRADLSSHPLFAGLGIEPLGPDMSAAALAAALSGRKAGLKSALLDQRTIAGLGNIYVCEALHRAKLSPLRAAGNLVAATGKPKPALVRLKAAIQEVLRDAIDAGGSSLRNHRQTDGSLGKFQHSFRVYGREGEACAAPGCRGRIVRIVQAGRSTFFCDACQK